MPYQFALNTAEVPGLYQVLFSTREGLFDYRIQQSSGKVTVASNKTLLLARAREIKHPVTGKKLLVES
jgi:hypothetical protein